MSIVRAPRRDSHFTTLGNEVIRDDRLSYRASGVLHDILSRPDNWRTNAEALARARGQEGREAIRVALHELQAAGYLAYQTVRDPDTGQISRVAFVYDEKRPTVDAEFIAERKRKQRRAPGPKNPASGKPASGNPEPGSSGPIRSTETKNPEEEPSKKKISCGASSSSSATTAQAAEEDDDATQKDQLAERRAAKAAAKQPRQRMTRAQREEQQARSTIAEHGSNSRDVATALLTKLKDDGIKYPGAYLTGVINEDGEGKIAEMCEAAESEYAEWISERTEHYTKVADELLTQPVLSGIDQAGGVRLRAAYVEARQCGWDHGAIVDAMNKVLAAGRRDDVGAYAAALDDLGVRVGVAA